EDAFAFGELRLHGVVRSAGLSELVLRDACDIERAGKLFAMEHDGGACFAECLCILHEVVFEALAACGELADAAFEAGEGATCSGEPLAHAREEHLLLGDYRAPGV